MITFRQWRVLENDFVAVHQKTAGAGRENVNFIFTGFSKFDRANPQIIKLLLSAVQAAAIHANDILHPPKAGTLQPPRPKVTARTLFWNKFNIRFYVGEDGRRLLEVPPVALFGVSSPQEWAQFEALLVYALSIW